MLDGLPLPRIALLRGPTPVVELHRGLWAKREDEAGSGLYGGNKVRKLEWLLGRVQAAGGDILTVGPAGSHHVLATAVYARSVGMRVHAVLWPQRDSPHARETLRAIHATVEHVRAAPSVLGVGPVWARQYAALRLFGGFPPAIIPAGGSDPAGCLGWVAAGMEIAAQVDAGELPPPNRVYLPVGTGGTAAGLWVGLALGGLRVEVVGVDVGGATIAGYDAAFTGEAMVRLLAARVTRRLEGWGIGRVKRGPLRIIRRPGYAAQTPDVDEGIRAGVAFGLPMEPTYTAKTLAVAMAEASLGGSALYIHTANGRPMAPLLASALPEVPQSLRGLLG